MSQIFSNARNQPGGPGPNERFVEFDEFRVDPVRRELYRNGELVRLTPKVFETLVALVENPGEVVTKEALLNRLWPDSMVEESNLTQNIFVLRKALGTGEGAGKYIQTVPRSGYRFVGQIRQTEPADREIKEPAQPLSPAVIPGQRRLARSWLPVILGTVVLCGAATAWWFARSQAPAIRSLAVLPFQNLSASGRDDYLADGLTELLIGTLAKGGVPRVISRTSSMQFRSTNKKLPEIARELKVDAVIEGSVARSGDRVRITVQLIEAATDKCIWSEIYDRGMRDLPNVDLDIARTIAREAGTRINAGVKAPRQVNRAAFEEYLRGRHAWNKRSPAEIKKAIAHFQKAVDFDAAYAAPYAGLADAHNQLGTHLIGERPARETRLLAIAAAGKAIKIDDELAEAHAALGYAKMYGWDWAGAERELRRAIDLNPSYGPVRIWYASWLQQQGRPREAVAQAHHALDLDPLSLIVRTQVGWIYSHGGEIDKALPYYRDVLEKDPNYLWAQWLLGQAYLCRGNYPEAVAVLEKAAESYKRTPAVLGSLGAAYARAGRKADAEAVLRELTKLARSRYVSPHAFTWVYLGLGDADRAFEWLEREYEERSNSLAWNRSWHMLDGYRSDPRYADLMRRVGLPAH